MNGNDDLTVAPGASATPNAGEPVVRPIDPEKVAAPSSEPDTHRIGPEPVANAGDPETVAFSGEPPLGTGAAQSSSRATIGPYRLIQQVGEGGMGEVWLAEQTKPVRRHVALKVIKAGMDTAQVVVRFDAERQALAMMDHPAIARVFDGGATPNGRPYFVMEYVRGEPIHQYCQRHKSPIAQRLALFMQVCEGVQHAHQKGIIHRDLKPSNVLVAIQDDKPVPKIIDFGVAKATTQTLTDSTLYTELGQIIGTPEYMSPEQAENTGLDVDTRTDVYALGVILYELLTGTLPFDSKTLRSKGVEELRRTIREVDPPRPSQRLATRAAAPEATAQVKDEATRAIPMVRGDLDWITMKTLEKDRTRRYGAASDLAADIRRHLEYQPVVAGPPSQVYRLKKFVRRNRFGVAAAATLVALLAFLAATMTVQAQRIARERDRTAQEADRANREASAARQVSDFLVGLFAVSDPSEARGNSLTAREVLDTGVARIEKDLTSQPEIQARLMETMGTVYTSLGLYRDSEPLLRRAVQTNRRTLGNEHLSTLKSLHQLADLLWYEGRQIESEQSRYFAEAERLYLEVEAGRRKVLGEAHADTLKVQSDIASLYSLQKRLDEAERLARKTLELQTRTLGTDHPDTRISEVTLQNIYFQQGRFSEAEVLARRVLESSQRRFGQEHPSTLTDMHNLSTIVDRLKRYDEAEKLYLRTIESKAKVLGPAHPSTNRSMLRLAEMYERWGKPEKAAEWRAKLPPG
jgi:eukaryotic-like serine/threonine-protein kinase